jgi:glucosamine-phosphate N-acetyltransferase
MGKEISFCPFRRSQMESVVELLQEISVYHPDLKDHDQIWNSFAAQENVSSLVALRGESEVVGFGALVVETKIRGGRLGHIEDVVIHPDYQGLGLGRAMVAELISVAEFEGCYKVALNCGVQNVAFYEKAGLLNNGAAMQRLL